MRQNFKYPHFLLLRKFLKQQFVAINFLNRLLIVQNKKILFGQCNRYFLTVGKLMQYLTDSPKYIFIYQLKKKTFFYNSSHIPFLCNNYFYRVLKFFYISISFEVDLITITFLSI